MAQTRAVRDTTFFDQFGGSVAGPIWKNKMRGELDYDVNRRAEAEIRGLARKLNLLGEKISDVEELLREKSS